MSKWSKLLTFLRLGGVVAAAQGVKVKGIPIETIQDEAEKVGSEVVSSVKRIKDAKKKPASGSSGE